MMYLLLGLRCEITLKNNEAGFIQLYDVLGNEVNVKQLNSGFNKVEFDLSNISDSVYMYKVIINAEIKSNNKLIITK